MARENVSFTKYGGESTCTPKSTGMQLRQRGIGYSTRTLASAGSNCSDTTKNPKMNWKEEAQFLLPPPPPPPPHTHTCAGAIHKGSVFEKCFILEEITPITIKHKICPLIPTQKYIRPPYALAPPPPPPPPLRCVLYHDIDSSDQWRVQGDSGGSLWTKTI